jgi:hypothetical protein
VTLAWSTPTVGEEFNQSEGANTLENQARDRERWAFQQYFDRLLGEVEASRSTETRDQLKEKLNKLYDEVNKLYDEANKQLFCQVRAIARELAISAEDPAEARHYADLVLHADAFGLISEEEEHAESAVIGHIRRQEGRRS